MKTVLIEHWPAVVIALGIIAYILRPKNKCKEIKKELAKAIHNNELRKARNNISECKQAIKNNNMKNTTKIIIGAASRNPVEVVRKKDPKLELLEFFQFKEKNGIQGVFEVRTKKRIYSTGSFQTVYEVMPVPEQH